MMLVDCQTCPVREVHCPDCMVTALARTPVEVLARRPGSGPEPVVADSLPLDPAERRAAAIFLAAGLVTPETVDALRASPERRPGTGRPVPLHSARRAAV